MGKVDADEAKKQGKSLFVTLGICLLYAASSIVISFAYKVRDIRRGSMSFSQAKMLPIGHHAIVSRHNRCQSPLMLLNNIAGHHEYVEIRWEGNNADALGCIWIGVHAVCSAKFVQSSRAVCAEV